MALSNQLGDQWTFSSVDKCSYTVKPGLFAWATVGFKEVSAVGVTMMPLQGSIVD